MDGCAIILQLLRGDVNVIALVPEDRIMGGVLPAGTDLDAIAINCVSSIDRNILAPGANRHVKERVEVTAKAADYPRLQAVLRAIKTACADFIGSAADLTNVTVHTAGAGPYFLDEQASIHMGSRDFIVGFTEAR